jgi:hypothetical protein
VVIVGALSGAFVASDAALAAFSLIAASCPPPHEPQPLTVLGPPHELQPESYTVSPQPLQPLQPPL